MLKDGQFTGTGRMVKKSNKLNNVCYDIRGPIFEAAERMEKEGDSILKLNIGNPAAFGFKTPEKMINNIILNFNNAQGYSDSRGIYSAREAIAAHANKKGISNINVDDIFIGNGVSELIVMSMQGLLNQNDEILIPAPDYPLWTAAVSLSGGKTVHYLCDEKSGWLPDIQDLETKVSSRTKGIVVINPNNPTGSNYPPDVLLKIYRIARERELFIFSDEIYDEILYEGATHLAIASLGNDVACLTFGGISKNNLAAGLRAGWMILSGPENEYSDYRSGLDILSNMRLCSNVPAQYAIAAALNGNPSASMLVEEKGRLRTQRDYCYNALCNIPGITCVKPGGALYCFPKIDVGKFDIISDEQFILDLLLDKRLLLVQGTGFNWKDQDHFRIVFLPDLPTLEDAISRLKDFLDTYTQVIE
jgi:alanine-synthesizing transaminase